MRKYLIIIAGWHYIDNGFYETIKRLCEDNLNVDVFISSHKEKTEIDINVFKIITTIPRLRIHCFENIGYDWGMYSQAVDYLGSLIMQYEYICFMHDDIEIIDNKILSVFSDFLEQHSLIVAGNCGNPVLYPFKKTHPHVIEWARLSEWKIDIKSERWNTVRGSFFMTQKQLFEKLKRIPYRNGQHSGFGNWGVIVFGGVVADLFGINAIKTISDEDLTSPYITEYKRGKNESNIDNNKKVSYTINERMLKVHFGCGKKYLDGYLNIDQSPDSVADVVDDVMSIRFDDNSVSEFVMYHFIEHLNKYDAENFLNNLYRYLCPGGTLIIEAPDIVKVAKLIIDNKNNYTELEGGAYGLRGFYGEPFAKMEFGDYHKWGYSEYTLSEKLRQIGYSKIYLEHPVTHGARSNRDLRIVAIK